MLKIIFFGTPEFVIPVLDSLLHTQNVIAVVTAPDRFDKKKGKEVPSPVKSFYQHYYQTHTDLNQRHPLQIFTPDTLTTFNSRLAPLQPDLFVVAAYGKIIPQTILDIPPLGSLNVHPSLLPKYRGPSPVPAAILSGNTTTGISIIKLDAQMDHGPLLANEAMEILPTDTAETLLKKLFIKSATMLTGVIKNYAAGSLALVPQDETQATYTKLLTKQDGYIDLNSLIVSEVSGTVKGPHTESIAPFAQTHTAEKTENSTKLLDRKNWKLIFDRKIRAYYPWPGVWTKVKIKNKEVIIKFLPQSPSLRQTEQDKEIRLREKFGQNVDDATVVQTQQIPFLIQPEGKKPMTIQDFLNGYPHLKELFGEFF